MDHESICGETDTMTSSDSTASYSRSDLISMLSILEKTRCTYPAHDYSEYFSWLCHQVLVYSHVAKPYVATVAGASYTQIISRLHEPSPNRSSNEYIWCVILLSSCNRITYYAVVARDRFLHFYGQHGARLSRQQSVHGKMKNPRTIVIKIFSPFLFFAPDIHLRELQNIFVDEIFYRKSWRAFIEALEKGWNDFILYVSCFSCLLAVFGLVYITCNISVSQQSCWLLTLDIWRFLVWAIHHKPLP